MQRACLPGMFIGMMLIGMGGGLFASEAGEQPGGTPVPRKAALQAKRGNKGLAGRKKKEAAQRKSIASEHRSETGPPGIDKEVRDLKERLQDLLARERTLKEAGASKQELAEVREQISTAEHKLDQIHAHNTGRREHRPELQRQAEKLDAATRRILHLRVAAENLKMAEEHDLARKLHEQAEVMERDVQEARRRLEAEIHDAHAKSAEPGPDVVQELRAEIERLRAEVKALSQKVEKR